MILLHIAKVNAAERWHCLDGERVRPPLHGHCAEPYSALGINM